MKFKVKGLVFVGFAAAILSAGAYAEATDANTVTSKAYVDGKYIAGTGITVEENAQGKKVISTTADLTAYTADGTTITLDNHEFSATVGDVAANNNGLVTGATVKTYVDGKVNETATLSSSSTTTAPNEKLVYDKLELKQNKHLTDDANDTGKVLVVDGSGNISVGTASASGSYQPYESAANKISGANGTWKALNSDVTDTAAAAQGFDGDNAASTTAIRTYVESKIENAIHSGETAKAPSQGVVYTQLGLKQNASEKASTIDTSAAETNNNDNDHFPTNAAVVTYVGNVLSTLPIPAEMPNACKAANAHCALVTSYANNTVTAEWTVMAQ